MGRYIGTPESLVSEIENIVPVASRYNTRCLYTTPGTYTFNVPSGVTSITAVAVGPGGKQCAMLECVVTCGAYECLAGFQTVIKCNVTQAGCNLCGPACNPTNNTCLCTFEVQRCLIVCGRKNVWTLNTCYSGDIASSNCQREQIYCGSFANQHLKYAYLPSGPGGGYVEKTANTATGCAYSIVVGQDCPAGGFSCVNGYNISICATGPKFRSCAGNTVACTTEYGYIGGSWQCLSPTALFTTCTLTTAACASPTRCYACVCYCGSINCLCWCTISTWCVLCEPGCGYGGDINRVGGWCVTNLCTSMLTNPNTSFYCCAPRACVLGTAGLGYLYSTPTKCFGGYSSDITQSLCCATDTVLSGSCCLGRYCYSGLIRQLLTLTGCGQWGAGSALCCCWCYCRYRTTCLRLFQETREVGNTISCMTNFSVNAPGSSNPYCNPVAGVNLLDTTRYQFCLWLCQCDCTNGYYYCYPSGDACANMHNCRVMSHFDHLQDCVQCVLAGPYGMMNCDLPVTTGNGRYKFGGSSAGNYYRDGVAAMNDDSTYAVNCHGCFGHCATTRYTAGASCNYNGMNNFSNCYSWTMCKQSCFTGNKLDVPYFYNFYCLGGYNVSASYGGDRGCSCCYLKAFDIPIKDNCCNNYSGWCVFPGTETFTPTNDIMKTALPGELLACSGLANFSWHGYTSPFVHWQYNTMFNNIGGEQGFYDRNVHSTDRSIACVCDAGAYFGSGTCVVYSSCVLQARGKLKYFGATNLTESTGGCALDCCWCYGPNVLPEFVVPLTSANCVKCNCTNHCSTSACSCTCTTYCCRVTAIHDYWPCCVCYNYCTAACKVSNVNGLINLYDYFCSKPEDCGVTCAGMMTAFCHLGSLQHATAFDIERTMTAFYYPGATNSCCVYKSTDQIDITDRHYNAQYVHGFNYCIIHFAYQNCCNGSSTMTCCNAAITQIINLMSSLCSNYAKCCAIACCNLSSSVNYAQGGAGIGTAGIWGEGAITCTLLCSGGGNIKCIVPCCNIQYCYVDPTASACGSCSITRALGWGLGPLEVQYSLVDLTACGAGAVIAPRFVGVSCSCGQNVTIGGCTGQIPFNSYCIGMVYTGGIDLLNAGGINYSSCTVVCAVVDCASYSCCWRWGANSIACRYFGCIISFGCGCWITEAGTYRCNCARTAQGTDISGCCMSAISQPLFCAIVQPTFATYSCVASTYSEGSGGGSKTGQSYCSKYATIIDSPTIVSITPARGGRGNESPYEPYYYSYPGISARLSTPRSPANYVGDPATGTSWFDTPQINGSGGNGMFCSANFSCIYVQPPGPGGGGANGVRSDGTRCANGGVLGGGAGCCGAGGYGGGAGWNASPGTGMVVIYWNV